MVNLKQYYMNLKLRFLAYVRAVKLDQKIVIGITLLTTVIIILLAWFISPNPQIEQAANQLAQTANNVRVFYQTKPGYWGLSTDVVIRQHLAAQNMLVNGSLQNAFGKPVLVGQDEYGNMIMPGGRNFVITFPHLNQKECIVMAAFRLNERETLSLLKMVIHNQEDTYEFTWGGKNSLPITKKDAVAYCGKENTVSWMFE